MAKSHNEAVRHSRHCWNLTCQIRGNPPSIVIARESTRILVAIYSFSLSFFFFRLPRKSCDLLAMTKKNPPPLSPSAEGGGNRLLCANLRFASQ
ncbi:hypothetical protein [Helicobacter macacae]|uniref:hypothetical protein n=1 Tax=Helicobacter macacae TaxID=398626 RepID=UPI0011DD6FE8|nr:hypothetical protein [Helicobacter macacae]